jgi:hypothetical protein
MLAPMARTEPLYPEDAYLREVAAPEQRLRLALSE